VNWLAYIVLLWIFLGLEKGLRDALALGSSGVAPSFVFIIVTMVAIYASPLVAMGGARGGVLHRSAV
jgi:hypothetical protein